MRARRLHRLPSRPARRGSPPLRPRTVRPFQAHAAIVQPASLGGRTPPFAPPPQRPTLPAHGPVCAAAPPVVTPAASGTKLGSNVAYLSRRGFLRTHALPLVWFQIARSGAFSLHFRIRPRVQDLTNMRPKRPGRARRTGQTTEASGRRCEAGGALSPGQVHRRSEHHGADDRAGQCRERKGDQDRGAAVHLPPPLGNGGSSPSGFARASSTMR